MQAYYWGISITVWATLRRKQQALMAASGQVLEQATQGVGHSFNPRQKGLGK
jgi:hypothetical protein